MTKPFVTVLGLGPMGRALTATLVRAGYPTTVWTRTATRPGVPGASRASTATEAVRASRFVIVCVINDDAVQQILAGVDLAGRTIINLTGDSPERSRRLAVWVEAQGASYLDGVIANPTIGEPTASFLTSGSAEVWAAVRPLLADLGGTSTYLGGDPGRAAAYDAALLDLFWNSLGGVIHAFALASAEGIAAAEFAQYARTMAGMVPDFVDVIAEHVTAGTYPGDESDLKSAAASLSHVIEAATARGLHPGGLPALLETTQRAIDAGHGDEGVSRLVEVLGR